MGLPSVGQLVKGANGCRRGYTSQQFATAFGNISSSHQVVTETNPLEIRYSNGNESSVPFWNVFFLEIHYVKL